MRTDWVDEQRQGAERPRRLHRTDWMALLTGLLFIAIGIRYLTGSAPDPVVMTPVLLGGLGIAKAIRR